MKLSTLIDALEYGQEKAIILQEKLNQLLSNSKFDEALTINNQIICLRQAIQDLEESELDNYLAMYEQLTALFDEIDGE
ncbi:hypothetical protein [Brevibacillus sp. NRS-1366]|uniref:hypothetical protein n=1 Tax=Brevibacillus sp. NRS-1366 TaxID=3233899 RepID=UPI003D1AC88E